MEENPNSQGRRPFLAYLHVQTGLKSETQSHPTTSTPRRTSQICITIDFFNRTFPFDFFNREQSTFEDRESPVWRTECEGWGAQGMAVARLNMSHGDHKSHKVVVDLVKEYNALNRNCIALMLDTKGPEVRSGDLQEPVELVPGTNPGLSQEVSEPLFASQAVQAAHV